MDNKMINDIYSAVNTTSNYYYINGYTIRLFPEESVFEVYDDHKYVKLDLNENNIKDILDEIE